mmetsp:Transcript_66/g.116  ORF Transcript_66/g.116 Transcript_66/m.116 type:complete len:305 (-) Transcript_66:178-1092(-)|eukprot:CAMPEP_0197291862 /NCGR_PEP_ID=MMETSP0890-20130614/19580_1 /TAXON_ID=44058 ORGANISM="Aureoumbra lagunensis, Strain CCMP1510" /NCGR_SAMPLE_ID=MMETSP0890 /ASSEMBLY_ACC=CAM_ASM_000533 /LENGTH=304 /DNA_ID=CAMNT_0042765301 /DNA_START=44 /DNA_END=958 /DNA_ORIENTATION=+
MSGDPDELYTLRNRFWLGNYQMAIAESNNLRLMNDELKGEKDEYTYRSYIGLGQYDLVEREIDDDAPMNLQAVKLLAKYLKDPAKNKEAALSQCDEWMEKYANRADQSSLQMIIAIIYDRENKDEEAFKAIKAQSNLEQMAFWAQLCIKIYRNDVAQQYYKKMQQIDEDSTLTQLVGAWVHLAQGDEKAKEAAYTYEELIDKFGASISLLNGVAVAHMQLKEYEDAEKYLMQAMEKGDNPETLANLISTYYHLNKPEEVTNRYISQLKSQYPTHPHVQKIIQLENDFDLNANKYSFRKLETSHD